MFYELMDYGYLWSIAWGWAPRPPSGVKYVENI